MNDREQMELLPCPFCGAVPLVEDQGGFWTVTCSIDACILGNMAIVPTAWNRRAKMQVRLNGEECVYSLDPTEALQAAATVADGFANEVDELRATVLRYEKLLAAADTVNGIHADGWTFQIGKTVRQEWLLAINGMPTKKSFPTALEAFKAFEALGQDQEG